MAPQPMLAAVPIKPFGVAKRRLSSVLDAEHRSRLGRAVAAHTLSVLAECGLATAVVTADSGVAAWAHGLGFTTIADPDHGLDAAAAAAVATSNGRWCIVHADLPVLTTTDIEAAIQATPPGGMSLAPSGDGGTNFIAGERSDFRFSYGPGSFGRHLAAATGEAHAVVNRVGLALDLDTPADLAAARAQSDAEWLR